jgi:SAM-dependent methyltransferase
MNNYLDLNKESWNRRTDVHINSEFYNIEAFLEGKTSLNDIELQLLGEINGKNILHLQCHFGQDSISLARLGANVTAIDLSDIAIERANSFAEKTQTNVEFICTNIYDLPTRLNKQFDIVFTSYGVIGWLPDLDKWAKVISHFLKPNGKLVFVEFHPFLWAYDDDFEKIAYNYFNAGPIVEYESGTYADRNAPINGQYVVWNHPTSEVLNSLISNGLEINLFNETDYSPYNCFRNTIEFEPNKFRIKYFDNKIPMVFSIVATKKS